MSINIHLPTALRPFAERQELIAVNGATVGEAVEDLVTRHAKLRKHLLADDGSVRNYVNIYVNDEDIRQLDGRQTRVKQGDTLMIVPSIAGGSQAATPLEPSQRTRLEVRWGGRSGR